MHNTRKPIKCALCKHNYYKTIFDATARPFFLLYSLYGKITIFFKHSTEMHFYLGILV